MQKIKAIYQQKFPDEKEKNKQGIGLIKEKTWRPRRSELGYLSDEDHKVLLQLTDPKENLIYYEEDFFLSEPELVPREQFVDSALRENIKLTCSQNGVLSRKEVKQNISLRVGLYKLFIYILRKVKIERAKLEQTISINNNYTEKYKKVMLRNLEETEEFKIKREKYKEMLYGDKERKDKKELEIKVTEEEKDLKSYTTKQLRSWIRNICARIASWILLKIRENYEFLIDHENEYIRRKKLAFDKDEIFRYTARHYFN